jgi:hypothetical protein
MTLSPLIASGKGLEMQPAPRDQSFANVMKEIGKARLRRQALGDQALAARLPALEASPVYNSKGELIQSLGAAGFAPAP